jgi:hypothetical protein
LNSTPGPSSKHRANTSLPSSPSWLHISNPCTYAVCNPSDGGRQQMLCCCFTHSQKKDTLQQLPRCKPAKTKNQNLHQQWVFKASRPAKTTSAPLAVSFRHTACQCTTQARTPPPARAQCHHSGTKVMIYVQHQICNTSHETPACPQRDHHDRCCTDWSLHVPSHLS